MIAQSKINQTHPTFSATTRATGKFVSSLDQALMNLYRGKTFYANTSLRMCTSLAWWRVVCRLDAHLNMDENQRIRRVQFMGLGLLTHLAHHEFHRNSSQVFLLYSMHSSMYSMYLFGLCNFKPRRRSWYIMVVFCISHLCMCPWIAYQVRSNRHSQLGASECLSIVSSVLFLGIELAVSSHVWVTQRNIARLCPDYARVKFGADRVCSCNQLYL